MALQVNFPYVCKWSLGAGAGGGEEVAVHPWPLFAPFSLQEDHLFLTGL